MGVKQAPEWLVPAFTRSAKALGADADPEQIQAVADRLLASWASPDRQHHAVRHLMDVLTAVDQLAEETHDPDQVRLAAWYHGAEFSCTVKASYAHKGGEDPEAGAARARRELPELGVPEATVERIAELAGKVRRHASGDDVDAQALSDADLAGLAAEPQKYKEYRKNIRAEYAHIPVEDYLDARIAILRKLSARPQIFRSPMALGWEEPARQNISAELAKLEAERAELALQSATEVPQEDTTEQGQWREGSGVIPKVADPARDEREANRTRYHEVSPSQANVDDSSSSLGRAPRY